VKLRACLLLALLVPAAVWADDFKYDYVDLGHASLAPQGGQDGSGAFVDVSYTVFYQLQLRAGYSHLDYSTTPSDITAKDYTFGITGESVLTADTDVYTDLLYLSDSSHQTSSSTDDGYRLAIGLRHWALPHLELDGYLAHNYLTLSSNEAGVAALYDLTPWLSLGAVFAHDSLHTNTTSLELRAYF